MGAAPPDAYSSTTSLSIFTLSVSVGGIPGPLVALRVAARWFDSLYLLGGADLRPEAVTALRNLPRLSHIVGPSSDSEATTRLMNSTVVWASMSGALQGAP